MTNIEIAIGKSIEELKEIPCSCEELIVTHKTVCNRCEALTLLHDVQSLETASTKSGENGNEIKGGEKSLSTIDWQPIDTARS